MLREERVSDTSNVLILVPFVATITGVVAMLLKYALCNLADVVVPPNVQVNELVDVELDFLQE